jgi:hypothetical protein
MIRIVHMIDDSIDIMNEQCAIFHSIGGMTIVCNTFNIIMDAYQIVLTLLLR